MNLTMLLDMVVEGMPDRVLIGDRTDGLTARELARRARSGSDLVRAADAGTVVYLGGNGPAFPVALFAAASVGVPFLPVNYRLSAEQLDDVLGRQAKPLVITDSPERVRGMAAVTLEEFAGPTAVAADHETEPADPDPDSIAVLLMTSGTTAAPKSAVLRHRHLTSYIFGSVEFASAEESDATIVSVPPYHIAAVANLLSNLYAGRRIVYLDHFSAADWLHRVRTQAVTHAMVVPTMLARIVERTRPLRRAGPLDAAVDVVRRREDRRTRAHGGAAALSRHRFRQRLRPHRDRLLHRGAGTGRPPYGRRERRSRRARETRVGGPCAAQRGDRGPDDRTGCRALPAWWETSSYAGRRSPVIPEAGSRLDSAGWFPTRDRGHIDEDGFIFVEGRSDDTIIRGGENIAPSEIESVLTEHEWVADVAVAGIPDDEWGQRIGAFVVVKPGVRPDADVLREFVRGRLRSSKTPDDIVFLPELPTTPTGKVLRRKLVADIDKDAGAPEATRTPVL